MTFLTESVVEDTALAWLEALGHKNKHTPGTSARGATHSRHQQSAGR